MAGPDLRKHQNLKSEGQRLLLLDSRKSGDIAKLLGVTKQAVGQWRNGVRKPDPNARRKLQEHAGIPATTWDKLPDFDGAEPASKLALAPAPAPVAVSAVGEGPPSDVALSESAPAAAVARAPTRRQVQAAAPELQDDSLALIDGVIRSHKAQLSVADLVPEERARVNTDLLKAITTKQKLLHERSVFDDKIVRQAPFYARMKAALADALQPFPDAAKAAAAALRALEDA